MKVVRETLYEESWVVRGKVYEESCERKVVRGKQTARMFKEGCNTTDIAVAWLQSPTWTFAQQALMQSTCMQYNQIIKKKKDCKKIVR